MISRSGREACEPYLQGSHRHTRQCSRDRARHRLRAAVHESDDDPGCGLTPDASGEIFTSHITRHKLAFGGVPSGECCGADSPKPTDVPARRVLRSLLATTRRRGSNMKAIARVICLTVVLCIGAMAPGAAGENWTLIHDIALLSKSPSGRGLKDETVTADLYRPNVDGRVPAAVIINSSGGGGAPNEPLYSRLLALRGGGGLGVDTALSRGVGAT